MTAAAVGCGMALWNQAARAESPHVVNVMGGLGFVFADSGEQGFGSGYFAAAEYAYSRIEAITPRAYAGVLGASPDHDCDRGVAPCELAAHIFFFGGKLRLLAPLPYVAPFIEVGFGASAGTLHTRIGSAVDKTVTGITPHVPVAVGLGFGARHEWQVSFQYLLHGKADQVGAGFVLAYAFPVSDRSDSPRSPPPRPPIEEHY